MVLKIHWDRVGGVLISLPAGRIDSANSTEFEKAMESGIPSTERALLLDLRNLSYMSSAGLRVLLVLSAKFRGSSRRIAMCRLSDSISGVVTLSGFHRIIPVYETRASALEAMPTVDESDPAADAIDPAAGDTGTPEPAPDKERSKSSRWSFKRHSI